MDFLSDLKGVADKVSETLEPVSKAVESGKQSFAKALVDATDFTPADMRQQEWAKQQKAERTELVNTAADLVLPDQYDIMAPGIGKIGKAAKIAAKIVDEGGKVYKAGSKAAEAAKAVPVIESTKKGFDLLQNPVEKVQKIGNIANVPTTAEKILDAKKAVMKDSGFRRNAGEYMNSALSETGKTKVQVLNEYVEKMNKDSRFDKDQINTLTAAMKKALFSKP